MIDECQVVDKRFMERLNRLGMSHYGSIDVMSSLSVASGMPSVIENVAIGSPQTPDYMSEVFYGSRMSSSGEEVNQYVALSHPPILQGVTIISGDVGQLPMVLKRHRGRKHDVDRVHVGGKVARHRTTDRNNPMPISAFREVMMNHALLQGNGCAYIDRDDMGRPYQLIPLPPYPHTYVEYDAGASLYYCTTVQTESGQQSMAIDPIDIFHVMGLSHDGLWGYRLVDIARDAIGHGVAIRKHGASSFANDQVPSGVISFPGKLDQDSADTLRRNWFAKHGGTNRVGNVALLPQSMTYTPVTFSNDDAQMIEALEKDRELQASLLNIPKFMLGIGERPGFTNAQLYQFYLTSCLNRWLNKWCEQANSKLLTGREIEQGELQFEFDTKSFLSVDFEKKVQAVNSMVGGPTWDRDEGREFLGMNPAEPGQVFLERSTGAPGSDPEDSQDNQDIPNPDRQAMRENDLLRGLLNDRCQGLARTESQLLSAAAAKESDFNKWADDFYGTQWVNRLSDLIPIDVATQYCSDRRATLSAMLDANPASLERDLREHKEHGRLLVNMVLGGKYGGV